MYSSFSSSMPSGSCTKPEESDIVVAYYEGQRKSIEARTETAAKIAGKQQWPEALKPAGYRSYMAGKWHVCKDFAPDGPKHAIALVMILAY